MATKRTTAPAEEEQKEEPAVSVAVVETPGEPGPDVKAEAEQEAIGEVAVDTELIGVGNISLIEIDLSAFPKKLQETIRVIGPNLSNVVDEGQRLATNRTALISAFINQQQGAIDELKASPWAKSNPAASGAAMASMQTDLNEAERLLGKVGANALLHVFVRELKVAYGIEEMAKAESKKSGWEGVSKVGFVRQSSNDENPAESRLVKWMLKMGIIEQPEQHKDVSIIVGINDAFTAGEMVGLCNRYKVDRNGYIVPKVAWTGSVVYSEEGTKYHFHGFIRDKKHAAVQAINGPGELLRAFHQFTLGDDHKEGLAHTSWASDSTVLDEVDVKAVRVGLGLTSEKVTL